MKKVLALIIAVLMLSSLVVVSTAAEDEINWELVTHSIGMNIYIGDATTTAPTTDGVVTEGEYPFTVDVTPEEIYGYASGEIQSGVKEYFAHDADYVYYAVEFTQENDNRAFQWQFKPFDTFDIFRGNQDMTKYYYTRVSWQARYKVDDEGAWTDYAGSYQPNINDGCVRVPTAVDETSELYCVAGKDTETNLKTYEVRLAKAYLAEINECEASELRTLSYFTYFHSAAAVAHLYTEDDLVALSDADYSVFLPSANEAGYRFIVLADESTAPHIHVWDEGVVTTEPTEDEEGVKTYTCECGETKTESIPALGGGDDDDDDQTTTTTTTTTTKKDTTTTTTTKKEEPKKGGCKGSIAISALVIAPVLAGGAVLLKKKED